MKSKINFKKPTVIAVILFLVLLGWMLSKEAKATNSYEFVYNTSSVGGERQDGGMFIFSERFSDKYQVGLILTTSLTCPTASNCKYEDSPANQAFFVQRIVHYNKFELGIGASYWHSQTAAWNSNTPFSLSVGYNINTKFALTWRHFSTGGSSTTNPGLDMLTLKYTF